MTRIERVNIALTVIISLGFAALAVFVFSSSYLRLWETLVDLWSSIKYYFCELFNIEKDFAVSVNNLSDVFTWETWLPPSWEGFQDNAFAYLQRVFSKDNFLAYLGQIQVATIAKALVIAIPIVLVLVMLIRHIYRQENTRHNVDTRPLRIYKWIMARTFLPISRFARQYWQYVNRHSTILLVWILTWCLSLNLASIIVAFFAFYFFLFYHIKAHQQVKGVFLINETFSCFVKTRFTSINRKNDSDATHIVPPKLFAFRQAWRSTVACLEL